MKAQVARIDLGFTQFDGLMMPSGEYAIAVSEIARLFKMSEISAISHLNRFNKKAYPIFTTDTEFDSGVKAVELKGFVGILHGFLNEENRVAEDVVIEICDHPIMNFGETILEERRKRGERGETEDPKTVTEKSIQKKLQRRLGGRIEVSCLSGSIDLLTNEEIIEIKSVASWKHAIGQVLVYSRHYPSHRKRIHLFGETQESYLEMIRSHCDGLDITVTWQQN